MTRLTPPLLSLARKKRQIKKYKGNVKFRSQLDKAKKCSNSYVSIPKSSEEFPIERLHFLEILGAGHFGKVMKAEALDITQSGRWEIVAVKTCHDTATNSAKEELYQETLIMRKIPKHPNVVAYLGLCSICDPLLMILEYVPGGDLLHFLRRRRPNNKNKHGEDHMPFTQDERSGQESEGCREGANIQDQTLGHCRDTGSHKFDHQKRKELTKDDAEENPVIDNQDGVLLSSKDLASFALQIARGMTHLTANKIIHRDVAARNVLLGIGNQCKITDFGLARDVEGNETYERSSSGPLPIRWMSPESLTDGRVTYKSDVWSFGILLWEIITLGASPYSGMSAKQVIASVVQGKKLEKPNYCQNEIYNLMSHCWKSHPKDRPTFSELSRTLEILLEEEAEYIQLGQYDEGVYDVIDPDSVSIEEEKV